MSGGYTGPGDYQPVGIVHRGEYVFPAPYDYPRWFVKVRRFLPRWLDRRIARKVRVYNPKKDFLEVFRNRNW